MIKSAKIRKRKDKDQWKVYSEEGKPLSKWYDSKKKAKERLRQIEYFKHNSADDLSILDLIDQSNYDMPTLNRKNTDVFPHTKNSMYLYPGGPEVLGGKQTPYIDQDDSEDYYRFFEGESEVDLPPINEKGKRMNKRLLRKEEIKALSAAYNLDTFEKVAYTDYLSSSTNALSRTIYIKAINYAFYKCIKETNYLTDFSRIRKIEMSNYNNLIQKEALAWKTLGIGALLGSQILGSQTLTTQIATAISTVYGEAKFVLGEAVILGEELIGYVKNDLITDLSSFVNSVDSFLLRQGIDLPTLLQNGFNKIYQNGRVAFAKLGTVINLPNILKALEYVSYTHNEQKRVKEFFTTELVMFSQAKERKMIESISRYIEDGSNVVRQSDGASIVREFVSSVMDFSSEFETFLKISLPAKAMTYDAGIFDIEGLNDQMVKEEVIMFHNFPMYFQEMISMYDKALGKVTLTEYKRIGRLVASNLKN